MKASGNTVLITGGGAGIGLALAALFLKQGNEVIICGRTKATLEDAKLNFPKLNYIVADVSTRAGREVISGEISKSFPGLNVLINNAGIYSMTSILDPDFTAVLQTELAANLVAPIALIQQLMPVLSRQPDAVIANVTTGYVFIPSAQAAAYSASKTGLRTVTQALRFNLRRSSVRVVEVMPPAVNTQMNKGKNITLMAPEIFAAKVFKGLVDGKQEIAVGASKLGKIFSRIAPSFAFNKMNNDEERQRLSGRQGLIG